MYVTLMESDAVEPSGRAEGDTSPGSDAQQNQKTKKVRYHSPFLRVILENGPY